jgi:hypothetical protein
MRAWMLGIMSGKLFGWFECDVNADRKGSSRSANLR